MNISLFSFIFAMWVLIIIGGGLMVIFIGPLSFSGYGDLNPLINSGVKVLIAMVLIFIWGQEVATSTLNNHRAATGEPRAG